jgi:hypothetical protein
MDAKVAAPEASMAETSHAYELKLARRRAEIALKKSEIAQKQFVVMQGKYELAKQERDLFAAQSEAMEEHAKSIRATVGLSLEDLRAEEEQAAAAQHAAQTEKQKAQQAQWFLPAPRRKLLRAVIRLVQSVVLPMFLLFAGVLIFQFVAVGKPLFAAIVVALAGGTAYRLLKSALQELFKPWDPPQRLINCRDSIAVYLYRHLHRIILYVSIFLTIIYILEVIHYHEGVIALLRLVCDVGLLVLFILMAYNKEAFVSLLPSAENRLEKTICVTVTQVYPLLVLFLICVVALSNLGYANLARFLASSCALTAVILVMAHFTCKGLDKLIHWGLVSRNRVETDFVFSRETRETLYLILTHGLSYLVHIAAIVVIAGTWGVDLSGVYATLASETARNYYQRGSVPFSVKAEGEGHHHQSARHSTLACPFPSSMILRCAPAINTSPTAMSLLLEDYAAAAADGARMRWRRKSTPARP